MILIKRDGVRIMAIAYVDYVQRIDEFVGKQLTFQTLKYGYL
ncbi:hypothetical protein [Leptolyngbya sp. Cla-17]|nr:hypothetical protein [Leptolyngbya sp. Cla-17]